MKNNILYIIIFCLFSFVIYKQFEINKSQKTLQSEVTSQKELVDNITRSSHNYYDKLDSFIKENNVNLKAIKEDLNKLNANINSVNIVTTNSTGYKKENQSSTSIGPQNSNIENIDKYDYMKFRQEYSLYESFKDIKIPFGKVGFSAWEQKPWSIDVLNREYKLISIISMDENQKQFIYNKFSIIVDNKQYDLPITRSELRQEYPKSKFNFWNPRLFLSYGGSIDIDKTKLSFNFGALIGIMSYGQYKINPNLSILQVGLGYQINDRNLSLLINPINFNIGKFISNQLINNTYIGPSIQFDINSNLFIGINLTVGL